MTDRSIDKRRLPTLVIYFTVFLGLVIGFVQLAGEVRNGETLTFDRGLLRAINTTSSPLLDSFFVGVTNLGGVLGVVTLTLIGLTLLLVTRRYWSAVILTASVAGSAAVNVVLKLVFERARPDLWEQLITETSYSFPSGHAMATSALAFAVIAIAWKTRYRMVATIGALGFMAVISYSRLYLGVHYPTDILAGWLVSATWVYVVLTATTGWSRRSRLSNILYHSSL